MRELQAKFVAKLKSSGLTLKDAQRCGFELYTAEEVTRKLPGLTDYPAAGFTIPYPRSKGYYRFRYLDQPRLGGFASGVGARRKKEFSYLQPKGTAPEVYFSPLYDWKALRAFTIITEGENKGNCACKLGLPTLALGGVDCFGSKRMGIRLLEELKALPADKPVYICYDSDVADNFQVAGAINRLCEALMEGTGAATPPIFVVTLPSLGSEKTGLDDYLVAKGADSFIELLAEAKPWAKQRKLHELNEHVCYVRDPSCVVEHRAGKWNIMRVDTFYDVYANETMKVPRPKKDNPDNEVTVSAAREWLKSKARNEAEGMVYAPGEPARTERNELNRWRPSGITPRKGSIAMWKQITDLLFGTLTAAERTWVEHWIAYPLQHPGIKLHSALVVWGPQGTGKTLVGSTIGMLYGGTNWRLMEHVNLSDQFNATWAEDTQFSVGDEVTAKADNRRDGYNRLKSLITRKVININQKFKPVYSTPDVINHFFTSNNADCFYMDDDDRRLMVVEVRGVPLGPDIYKRFSEWRDSGGLANILYHYLYEVDCAGFNPNAQPPLTEAKRNMITEGRSPAEEWACGIKEQQEQQLTLSLLQLNPGDSVYDLYTISELTEICRKHTPDETNKKRIDSKTVGEALAKARYRKVICCRDGRMELTYNTGLEKKSSFERVWVLGDRAKLELEKDPEVVRERYLSQRGFKPTTRTKPIPISKAAAAVGGVR